MKVRVRMWVIVPSNVMDIQPNGGGRSCKPVVVVLLKNYEDQISRRGGRNHSSTVFSAYSSEFAQVINAIRHLQQ
jgi:hypothetical protein